MRKKVETMTSIFRGQVAARSIGAIILTVVLLVVVSLMMVPSVFLGTTAVVTAASNSPVADVWGVKSVDATHFWGVAGTRFDDTNTCYGVVLFYNGNNVVEQYRYDPGTGNNGVLYGVDALSATDVWAVGGWNMAGNGGVILHGDGTNWTVAAQNQPNLMQVSVGDDANNVWAAGYSGPFDSPTGKILFFNGTNWTEVHSEAGLNISTVYALDNTHVWAFAGSPTGGAGKILFFDGFSWSEQQTIPAGTGLYNFRGTGTDNLWASCGVGPQRPEGSGAIYKFNGTSTWEQVYTRDQWLEGLYVADANHVWAAGEFGTVVFFNGSSWSVLAGGVDGAGDVNLHGADGYDAAHVWVSGQTENEELPTIAFIAPTPAGSEVGVQMPALLSGTNVSMKFNQVTTGGSSTAIPQKDPTVKFQVVGGTCMEVQTSATHTGKIEVSVAYDPATLTIPASSLRLMHKQGGTWVDVTKSVDSANHLVTGEVDSLSPFVLGATAFYFAEGNTRTNFQEYLCMGNSGDQAASANVTYMFSDGTTKDASYSVPANSRYTVDVNSEVGPNKELSLKVLFDSPNLVAERPMYFNYNGKWTGGHDAVGATAPNTKWYFAEGNTLPEFDQYITVLNPGNAAASLTFHYIVEGQGEKLVTEQVGPHSRATFKTRDQIGDGKNVSLYLESDQPVVAERPMYFNYLGLAANNWTGGHDVVGTNSPAKDWYFAEGTTRKNSVDGAFEQWLCLQNPGTTPLTISATYQLAVGQGNPVAKSYTVPAQQRLTVSVNGEIGPDKDCSVHLNSTSDFIAERPMYFSYHAYAWTGGHDVLGVNSTATTWFFAEGTTRTNFEQWLCLQNPGNSDAQTTISYFATSGQVITKQWTVKANTRLTVSANSDVGANQDISVKVSSDKPIIVERPMYFNYQGVWTGGHDVVGFTP